MRRKLRAVAFGLLHDRMIFDVARIDGQVGDDDGEGGFAVDRAREHI